MSELDRHDDYGVAGLDRAWSPSRIKSALECGKKYSYKYGVDKIEEPPSVPLEFGDAFHRTVDAVEKEGLWLPQQYAIRWKEIWAENAAKIDWIKNDAIRNKEKKKSLDELGPKMVKLWVAQFSDKPAIRTEYKFPAEDGKQYFLGDYEVTGIIDRFCIWNDYRPAIVDYKTGKRSPSPAILGADVQFTIYHAVGKIFLGESPHLYWYHARDGKFIETYRDDTDVDTVIEMISEGQKIREEQKILSRNVGFHCTWCNYQKACLNKFAIPRGVYA